MHLTFPGAQVPAGLVVRSAMRGKTLSLWQGDVEMSAGLSQEQAKAVADALLAPAGVTQIVGQVSAFRIPAYSR